MIRRSVSCAAALSAVATVAGAQGTKATAKVHGMGPFTLTYVNPADDPRKAAAPAN